MVNFKKTKDPRGVIYCKLGQGEIAALTGRKLSAGKYLAFSVKEAASYRFAVEKCYADTLEAIVSNGKTDNTCYDHLGLKLRFHKLPLNIP